MRMSAYDHASRRWKQNADAYKHSTDSRQQARARSRRAAMKAVNAKYGFEPRKPRRGIALALAKSIYKQTVMKIIKL
jgi:hypothetical protein